MLLPSLSTQVLCHSGNSRMWRPCGLSQTRVPFSVWGSRTQLALRSEGFQEKGNISSLCGRGPSLGGALPGNAGPREAFVTVLCPNSMAVWHAGTVGNPTPCPSSAFVPGCLFIVCPQYPASLCGGLSGSCPLPNPSFPWLWP